MPIEWDDDVDAILGNDLAVGLTYVTPAKGTVITPMAPLGIRDRDRGTVSLSTSLGLPKKLIRIRANPNVAVAYHAREHSQRDSPDFVLVQGRASFDQRPDREWLDSIGPEWERFLGPRHSGPLGRALRVYYYERVEITVEVERILRWRNQGCEGEPEVIGAPLPEPAAPQSPPRNGVGPRVSTAKLRRHAERLPHALLGWVGGDGLPLAVAVHATGADEAGVDLESGALGLVPPAGRRAGLTAHAFKPRMVGQEQRIYTGWLERDGDRLRYSPHTAAGYALPASKALFVAGSTVATRAGMRKARAAGLA
jgi:hypothetical protein